MPHPTQSPRTPFGRYMAAVRSSRDERLRDMALVLDMSPAYLSSIEVGRRNVPDAFFAKLVAHGYAHPDDASRVEELIHLSRTTERVNVKHLSLEQQRLVRMFAALLPSMTDSELDTVRALLEPEVRP